MVELSTVDLVFDVLVNQKSGSTFLADFRVPKLNAVCFILW